jgi:uncharacterized protein involved in type VI secretion and phage assembly
LKNYHGIYPGIVIDNKDPLQQGRVKIRVEQIFGTEQDGISNSDLPWAFPCFPFIGKNSGFFMIPEIGTGIWIMFLAGYTDSPIWIGSWVSNKEKLSNIAYTPDPKNYLIQSPGGNYLLLDDKNRKIDIVASQDMNLKAMALKITLGATFTMSVIAAAMLSFSAALTATVSGVFTLVCTNIILGQEAQAKKLLTKAMLDLYNSHTHKYIPGDGTVTTTGIPEQQATEDEHATVNIKGS